MHGSHGVFPLRRGILPARESDGSIDPFIIELQSASNIYSYTIKFYFYIETEPFSQCSAIKDQSTKLLDLQFPLSDQVMMSFPRAKTWPRCLSILLPIVTSQTSGREKKRRNNLI
jgi:hypothetical protein